MSKKSKLFFSLIAGAVLLIAGVILLNYSKKPENLPNNPTNGGNQTSQNIYQAKIDQAVTVFGINVTPLAVIEDSRCPLDVQCIQAGTVRVKTRISDEIEATEKILSLKNETTFGDISITLKAVSPSPNSRTVIGAGDYIFSFEIKKIVQNVSEEKMLDYANNTYGLSFSYPDSYILDEEEVGNGERFHYVITLAPKSAFPLPAGGEGPPTITINIYQNDLDNLALDSWLRNTNFSNFKLSDGKYTDTTISGASAVRYYWSGLYEAETIAFIHKKSIIAVSGMYLSPDDEIVKDFENLIKSLVLK